MKNKIEDLFNSELKVISIGLSHFAETLRDQGLDVEHVEWKPGDEDDQEMNDLLDAMGIE